MSERFLYLAIDLFTIAGPLTRAFEPRLQFWRRWPALLVATATMAGVFISWDVLFTAWGVWSFEPRYLVGIYAFGLPIEEWLFFLVVPYACVFSYEVLNDFWPAPRWKVRRVSTLVAAFCATIALVSAPRLYSMSAFGSAAVGAALLAALNPPWHAAFWRGYSVCLIPFLLVNGALTGSFTDSPVVVYSPAHQLELRIGTIPCEDSAYMLTMLLLTIAPYEVLKVRWNRAAEVSSLTPRSA